MNRAVLESAMKEGKIAVTRETLIRLKAIDDMDDCYSRFIESFGNVEREDEAYDNIAAKYYDLIESMKAEIFAEIMGNLGCRVFCGI